MSYEFHWPIFAEFREFGQKTIGLRGPRGINRSQKNFKSLFPKSSNEFIYMRRRISENKVKKRSYARMTQRSRHMAQKNKRKH